VSNYISEVSYTDKNNKDYISEVRVSGSLNSNSTEVWGRRKVVNSIEAGNIFYTKYKESNSWKQGSKVNIIDVDGDKYLRTDSNKTKKDNLGKLPEF